MTNLFKTAIEAALMGDFVLVVASLIVYAIVLYIFYLIVNK